MAGAQLLGDVTLAVFYFIFLIWLFLGIGIIADLFMEAIEVITSTTQRKEVFDKSGQNKFFIFLQICLAHIHTKFYQNQMKNGVVTITSNYFIVGAIYSGN